MGCCRKLPIPLPSLASDMSSASCQTLPDLASGTCSAEASEALCFPPLPHGQAAAPGQLRAMLCQSSQDSKGPGPLSPLSTSSALLCLLRNQSVSHGWSKSGPSLPGPAKAAKFWDARSKKIRSERCLGNPRSGVQAQSLGGQDEHDMAAMRGDRPGRESD